MNKQIKGLTIAAILAGAGIVAYGLLATAPSPAQVEPEDVATSVRITQINLEQLRLSVRAQGTVTPKTESALIPEVSGKVQWISSNLVAGGYFEQDELLIKVDDRDLRSTVTRSRAALSRAKAEADHSRFELDRLKALVKQKLTSQASLESAERAERVSRARMIEAEVALNQAERDLKRTEIRAPYKGLVRNKSIDLGQYISRGQAIATIYASDSVEVRLPLADSQLAFLDLPLGHRGALPTTTQAKVLLSTRYGGKQYEWHGKLVRTEAEIDTRTRMVHAVVRVEEDSQQIPLPVGLFVHAVIEGRVASDVVVLPRAVLRNQTQVLVVDNENRLRFRNVELLRFDRDNVIISAGLNNGDRVNLTPLQTVIDGMLVKPLPSISAQPSASTSAPTLPSGA